jgi:hypothetical protein
MNSGLQEGLTRVWGSSPSDVYAVGAAIVLHYDGKAWNSVAYGLSGYSLKSVWGSSSSDVFVSGASGSGGAILHYDGSSWSVAASGLPGTVSSIWGTSAADVFAVATQYSAASQQYLSVIYHFAGDSWREMTRSQSNSDIRGDTLRDMWGSSSKDVYAVGERLYSADTPSHNSVTTVIYHYDGTSWSSITGGIGRLYGVWGSSSSNIFAVMGMQGREDTVYHWDGVMWRATEHNFGNYLLGVSGASSSDVLAVGYGGLIFHHDGHEWKQMAGFGATTDSIANVWGASSSDVYAVGGVWNYPEQTYHSAMFHYDGSSWNKVKNETNAYTYDIWGTSSNDIFTVGRGGTVSHYNGLSWTQMNSGVNLWIRAVWGSSPSDVFAVGQNGLIIHYDGNSANQWTSMSSGTTSYLMDVWGSSSRDVFAVGATYDAATRQSNPIILHYDGTKWSRTGAGIAVGSLSGVWGSSSSDVFVVGGAAILHYDGASWKDMSSGGLKMAASGIWGLGPSDVYAIGSIGDNGGILHYDGQSWSVVSHMTAISANAIWGTSSSDVFIAGQGGTILHYSEQ